MENRSRLPGEPSLDHPGVLTGRLGHMARNPSGMMVELTASRPAHGDKVYPSRTRSTSYTSRKPSRRSLEEGRTGARIRARVETMASYG